MTKEEELKVSLRKKTTAVCGFTRVYNSISKLLDAEEKVPVALLKGSLADLKDKYEDLETIVNDTLLMLEDEDGRNADLVNLLASKYDLMVEIRAKVEAIVCQVDSKDSHNSATEQLVKSFQASLTLPKPNTKGSMENQVNFRVLCPI